MRLNVFFNMMYALLLLLLVGGADGIGAAAITVAWMGLSATSTTSPSASFSI